MTKFSGIWALVLLMLPNLVTKWKIIFHRKKAEKHACKGKNSCKGQGGDGKNACIFCHFLLASYSRSRQSFA